MEVEIRSRNGWLYAVVKRPRGGGRAVVRRLGTRSMEEAERIVREAGLERIALAAKADAIGRDVWTRIVAGRKMRVRDCVVAFEAHRYQVGIDAKTIAAQAGLIDFFLRETGLANHPIAALETEHVSSFVNPADDTKLTTRQWRLGALKVFLDYCFDQRWIVRNPAIDVVVRIDGLTQEQLLSVPIASFTDDEVKRILAATPRTNFWHGAVLLGFQYGLRISQVATLEEGNIVANRLRVFTTKGRRVVDEPMSPDVAQWFLEWRDHRPASDMPYCFPAQASLPACRLSEQFTRLIAKIGITGKSFHSLRKAAAAREWNDALKDLGDEKARLLAKLVMENGYRKVQALLAHAQDSDVTDRSYLPRSPP
jgi:integrase